MKGLALSVIISVIIALVGVSLLLLIISGDFQQTVKKVYCDTYVKISQALPSGKEGTPSVPKFCMFEPQIEGKNIRENNNTIVSRIISAHIIACWKKSEIAGIDKSIPCYELSLSGQVDGVTEKNVTDILIKEDHCESIENNDFGCGTKNQILWEIADGTIDKEKIILIKYNADKDAVEVLG